MSFNRTRLSSIIGAIALAVFAVVGGAQGAVAAPVSEPSSAAPSSAARAPAGSPSDDVGSHTITNDQFWHDTSGNPIYSQGGGVFKFGDTYYWYGVHYTGADEYYNSPTKAYSNTDKDVKFVSIPIYTSKDLVNWTFAGNAADTSTPLAIPHSKDVSSDYFSRMQTLDDASWLGRLGVVYNEHTGKYVLVTQMETKFDPDRDTNAGELFLESDSPTGPFHYANFQTTIAGTPVQGTGDQTVFTDDDGSDYLVFSSRNGRKYTYVSQIDDADSLSIDPAVQVGYNGAGREGNAMFKLDGHYYIASSDLHGWNSSVTHVIESKTSDIQGAYGNEFTLAGTEQDYSHVTQSGFFITVHGTKQDTVIDAGDRWADFAWNGLGYNQWEPISVNSDGQLQFNSLSQWNLDATTGEWSVGAGNNYVLNPEFGADRVAVSDVTGWTTKVDPGSGTDQFVSNPSPGAGSTRFDLQLGASEPFSGSVSQQIQVPAGQYTLSLQEQGAGGLDYARVRITDSGGTDHVLDLNQATDGWTGRQLGNIELPGGTVTISIEARGSGGQSVSVDALSLTSQAPAWNASTVYNDGDTVSYQGSIWQASWWTQNQRPGDPTGAWQQLATGPDAVTLWTPTRIFDDGDQVSYDGSAYRAKWWTRNQAPGAASGPWERVSS